VRYELLQIKNSGFSRYKDNRYRSHRRSRLASSRLTEINPLIVLFTLWFYTYMVIEEHCPWNSAPGARRRWDQWPARDAAFAADRAVAPSLRLANWKKWVFAGAPKSKNGLKRVFEEELW